MRILTTPAADAPDRPRPPLPHKARVAALMRGDFVAALADRNADVWRPAWAHPVPAGGEANRRGGVRVAAHMRAQRRPLKLMRGGRLSAAARALGSATPALRTAAVWDKAVALFPPASSASATPASVAADFSAALADAADSGKRPIVPRAVTREAAADAVRGAPKGSPPGPSGLRPEHLWALSAAGQDALLDVLLLLCGDAAVSRVPAVARHALGGADLLVLTKAGGSAPTACHASGPLGCRRCCASWPPSRWRARCAPRRPSCCCRRSSGWGCRACASASYMRWRLISRSTPSTR